MKTRLTEFEDALILHSYPYRETSLLLEVLTHNFGRMKILAKGAKRAKSAYRGLLQPFQYLRLTWSGKSEMKTLNQVELNLEYANTTEASTNGLQLPGACLLAGYYINELLLRVLPLHDPCPEIFVRYQQVLQAIKPSNLEIALRLFERDLLQLLGFGLQLTKEAITGAALKPEQDYLYFFEQGPISYDTINTQNNAANALKIKGSALLALAHGEITQLTDNNKVIKILLRQALAEVLGGRPLKTRELYKQIHEV